MPERQDSWLARCRALLDELEGLPLADRVDRVNQLRRLIHERSPFHNEPVDLIEWVAADTVKANDYNPNRVAPPEMQLLEVSVLADGYTQPIVTHREGDANVIVDGFHRHRVGKESKEVRERLQGYLPVVRIRADRADPADRRASTIRHNRARGQHGVEAMTDIVVHLKRKGWTDEKVAIELGMDADEVLRFQQLTGLAELFRDRDFSRSWEIDETALAESGIIDPETSDAR